MKEVDNSQRDTSVRNSSEAIISNAEVDCEISNQRHLCFIHPSNGASEALPLGTTCRSSLSNQESVKIYQLCRKQTKKTKLKRSPSSTLPLYKRECCENNECKASSVEKSKAHAEDKTSVVEMGCNNSKHDTEESVLHTNGAENLILDDDSDDQQRNFPDVGLKTASNADLLETQRLASTDVSRGLENRWLRSHFVKPKKNKQKPKSSSENERKGVHRIKQANFVSGIRGHISIIHFNDVYEISEREQEPVGGASRFATALKCEAKRLMKENAGSQPLVIFGGDCLNPSTLSCATQGTHMVEVLNTLKVDVAVFGNHEFDFGVEHAVNCISQMESTWLLSNVVDQLTKRNLVEGKTKLLKEHNGIKIGFLGLVEEEWLDTLATVDKSDLDFRDYVTRGREISAQLKEEGADVIIALTHMRWPNDSRLAREVRDIDIILGGHDHEYGVQEIDGCLIVKSGSDFRNFSSIDLFLREDRCIDARLRRTDVTRKFEEDTKMHTIVQRYMRALEKGLEKKIGEIKVDLDGRFMSVRTKETRLGNFVADIMAAVTRSDLVLINSGTFRSDDTHRSGDFKLNDLMKILPISDTVVIIEVTGSELLEALENGVSKYPKREGRFPQVSNMCFGFNPAAKPGQRVIKQTVMVGGNPIDPDKVYTMATKAYVARGKDGYSCLRNCKIKTDPDSGPLLSTVVRNHIKNVYKLLEFEKRNSCQVRVSKDGRTLTSNDGSNPTQAFIDSAQEEEPITIMQKFLDPIMDKNNNLSKQNANRSIQSTLHTPNFINYFKWTGIQDKDQLTNVRRQVLNDETNVSKENLQLLEERSKNPELLKWQVLPLLEARVFQCKEIP